MAEDDFLEQDLTGFDVPERFDEEDTTTPTLNVISSETPAYGPRADDGDDASSGSSTKTVDLAKVATEGGAAQPGNADVSHSSSLKGIQTKEEWLQATKGAKDLRSSQRRDAIRAYSGAPSKKNPSRPSSPSAAAVSPTLKKRDGKTAKSTASPSSFTASPAKSSKPTSPASATSNLGSPLKQPFQQSKIRPIAFKSSTLKYLEARYEKAKNAPGRKDAPLLASLQSSIAAQRILDEQRAVLEEGLESAAAREDWGEYENLASRIDALGLSETDTLRSPTRVSSSLPRASPAPASLIRKDSAPSPSLESPSTVPLPPPPRPKVVSDRSSTARYLAARARPSSALALSRRASPMNSQEGGGHRQRGSRPLLPPSERGPSPNQFDAAAASLDFSQLSALFRRSLEIGGSPSTLAHGCKLVALLAMRPGGNCQAGLGKTRAGATVVACMIKFPSDREVQAQGLEAVFRLGHDDGNQEQLGLDGACSAVLTAMRTFCSDKHLQIAGCKSLWILSAAHHANTGALGSGGACSVIISAMNFFSMEQEVQEWACRATINLTVNHAQNTALCGGVGGCQALVNAMKTFRGDRDVVYSGIRALLNLTCNDDANRVRCGSAGACRVVVNALHDFARDRDMQLFCCVVLDNFSRDSANRTLLQVEGAPAAVVAAMRSWPSDRDIAFQGCRAIYFLTSGHCAAEARAAVRSAMRAFPDDEDLQEEAADALGLKRQYTAGINAGRSPRFK